jgi:DNA-3-methyladenine glycosylase II
MTPENFLKKQDKQMAKLIDYFGEIDFIHKKREPFDALAKSIISQQLSNSASNSITERILKIHGKRPFKAGKFLSLEDSLLRECGISNNKIKAIKGVAIAALNKELTLGSFKQLTDEEALIKLTSYWGVGNWTAEMFMMFCLKRLDTFAFGDAGLQRAHKILYPKGISLEKTAEKWRPYRAVAAGYLWSFLDNPEVQEKIF